MLFLIDMYFDLMLFLNPLPRHLFPCFAPVLDPELPNLRQGKEMIVPLKDLLNKDIFHYCVCLVDVGFGTVAYVGT